MAVISKMNRFHGHQTVRQVYRQGRPFRANLVSLHAYKDPKRAQTRVAVVVSRKVNKSAVKRNRIRRRIYEIIRLKIAELKQPAELIFTVYKPEVENLEPAKLKAEIEELLNKAKLL